MSEEGCEELLKQFRDGKISKGTAGARIFTALQQKEPPVSSEQLNSAFGLYLDALEQHARILRTAASVGERATVVDRPNIRTTEVEPEEPDQPTGSRERRGRSSSPELGDGLLRKRPVNEQLYPWAQRANIAQSQLSPSLELTR
jgi:hypothetical protein